MNLNKKVDARILNLLKNFAWKVHSKAEELMSSQDVLDLLAFKNMRGQYLNEISHYFDILEDMVEKRVTSIAKATLVTEGTNTAQPENNSNLELLEAIGGKVISLEESDRERLKGLVSFSTKRKVGTVTGTKSPKTKTSTPKELMDSKVAIARRVLHWAGATPAAAEAIIDLKLKEGGYDSWYKKSERKKTKVQGGIYQYRSVKFESKAKTTE
jgi:hypothetical protein